MADDFTLGNLRRLSDADFKVADNEPDVRGWALVSASGRTLGAIDDLIVDTAAMKVRFLEVEPDDAFDGRDDAIYIPIANVDVDRSGERVVVRGNEAAIRGLVPSDFATQFSASTNSSGAAGGAAGAQRLTRAEEEVRIGKRAVQGGEVRVGKHVETEHVRDQVEVMREQVHIERRPVTDARAAAEITEPGADIRVPIVEEELVVEKRPVVKEELIVSKEQVRETRPVDVEVRKEQFDVHDQRSSRDGDAASGDSSRQRGDR